MFVEEARAKNHLDAGYWRGGADERGMVAAVAAVGGVIATSRE